MRVDGGRKFRHSPVRWTSLSGIAASSMSKFECCGSGILCQDNPVKPKILFIFYEAIESTQVQIAPDTITNFLTVKTSKARSHFFIV